LLIAAPGGGATTICRSSLAQRSSTDLSTRTVTQYKLNTSVWRSKQS